MSTTHQGMIFAEIDQIVAQQVANTIETIAIYEAKTRVAHDLMNRVKQQKDKVTRAHTPGPSNKKGYTGTLSLCNKCKLHHNRPCIVKCGNCKKVGHMTWDYRNPAAANNQRTLTCFACGSLGHYKNGCPEWKNQNQVNKQWKGKNLWRL
ncbi:reverse transcriptase domain-containing protein [Tanacetum coccineum]